MHAAILHTIDTSVDYNDFAWVLQMSGQLDNCSDIG